MDRFDSQLSPRWRPTVGSGAAIIGLILAVAMIMTTTATAEVVRAGGTGAAHGLMKRIGAAFSAQHHDTRIDVVPGLGSAGGIAAVADGAIDVAITGRPPKLDEAHHPLSARLLAFTAFGFASSHPEPRSIASRDIASFIANPKSAWHDGVPLRLILRPSSEVDGENLTFKVPGWREAIAKLRKRPEIPVASTDQENLALAETLEGSLAAVSLTQVAIEKPNLRFVAIDGVAPTLENIENGSYPYQKPFYLVVAAVSKPSVSRLVEFIRSAEGERILRGTGSLLAQQ